MKQKCIPASQDGSPSGTMGSTGWPPYLTGWFRVFVTPSRDSMMWSSTKSCRFCPTSSVDPAAAVTQPASTHPSKMNPDLEIRGDCISIS